MLNRERCVAQLNAVVSNGIIAIIIVMCAVFFIIKYGLTLKWGGLFDVEKGVQEAHRQWQCHMAMVLILS